MDMLSHDICLTYPIHQRESSSIREASTVNFSCDKKRSLLIVEIAYVFSSGMSEIVTVYDVPSMELRRLFTPQP